MRKEGCNIQTRSQEVWVGPLLLCYFICYGCCGWGYLFVFSERSRTTPRWGFVFIEVLATGLHPERLVLQTVRLRLALTCFNVPNVNISVIKCGPLNTIVIFPIARCIEGIVVVSAIGCHTSVF